MTYTIIFRTGGTERFQWRKTSPYPNRPVALGVAREIENMGYKAIVHKTADLETIGLPDTWEY